MAHGRSIRARMTIATVVLFGFVILAWVVAISITYPVRARSDLIDQADAASRHVTTLVDDRRFDGPIPPRNGVQLLQVADAGGRVVAAGAGMAGRPPLTRARPVGGDSRVSDRVCPPGGCLIVVGTSNRATAYGPIVAYAAIREPVGGPAAGVEPGQPLLEPGQAARDLLPGGLVLDQRRPAGDLGELGGQPPERLLVAAHRAGSGSAMPVRSMGRSTTPRPGPG